MKVKLGEVCVFQRGQSITKKDIIDGDVPVIAGGKQPAYYHNKANREKNIITISSSGANAGYVNFWTVPIFCSDSFTVKPKDDNQFIIRYLYYFLKSRQEYIYSLSRGCGIPHVYSADIEPFEIELVDIQTQKEIVAVLDKVILLINMRKEQLEKLDILVKSKFIEMFGDPVLNPKGWETKKLGEVCSLTNGNKVDNTALPLLNVKYLRTKQERQICTEGIKVNKNDYLILVDGENSGEIFKAFEDGILGSTFKILNINSTLSENYILYILHFYKNIFKKSKKGAAIPHLDRHLFKNTLILLPPLDLQNQFAEFVEQVEKNREKIKSSLNQLETLYSALMQEYFG